MARSILAVLVGAFLASAVFVAAEAVGHAVYPPPPGFDPKNMDSLRELMANIPAGALLIVALGWFLGTAVGAWFAARVARRSPALHAFIVGGILLAAGIANLLMLPHPLWFWPVGLAAFPLGALAGLALARRPATAG